MSGKPQRIVLTGFMGVGKSSVARALASMLGASRVDLDVFIEKKLARLLHEIIEQDGEPAFRQIETEALAEIIHRTNYRVISLGGGAWVGEQNRRLIKDAGCLTVWLESTFDHCWRNIVKSKRKRPLANNKVLARRLFDERAKYYCLADWHFIVRPDQDSREVARQIVEEIF
jgi:shikimate kinase